MDQKVRAIRDWLGTGSINIFGSQFSGEDTQSKKLATLLDAGLISEGKILRSQPVPEAINASLAVGELPRSDLFLQICLPYLSQPEHKDRPLVLNSVGRMKGEEQSVVQAAAAAGHPLKAVVVLHIPEPEVWRRAAHATKQERDGRTDDTHEVIQTRLEWFAAYTLPVIDYYRHTTTVIDINGDQSRSAVTNDIIAALATIAK